MKTDAVRSIIIGNIEAIDQGTQLLRTLTDEQYVFHDSPYIQSSIGQHFRHVIDMYMALVMGKSTGYIDYDIRRRGASVERSRQQAIAELEHVKRHISGYLQQVGMVSEMVDVKTEVTVDETHSVTIRSSLIRELVFTSSHAVHHYALISVIAKIQGVAIDASLGVAPATARFMRTDAQEAVVQ